MRVGVYGGTFDPPHLGHLVAASDAAAALRLDRVLWVPSADHPFKGERVRTPAETRLELVRAAVEGDPRFAAEGVELERPGPSYTVDTLRELRTRLPGAELFLLIGADNLAELPAWRESEALVRLARLAVVTRAGERVPPDASYPALHVPVLRVDVSSTEVRRRAAAGESIRYLVPEPVRRLIEARGLYRGPTFQSETHQGRTPC